MAMRRGLLVALEGIDGSGTSTQIGPLAASVRAQGREVVTTAEPTGGAIGLLLRQALLRQPRLDDASLALLFAADRLDHLAREVEPALARGAVVLTDRYLLSSYAYQASTLPAAWVQGINSRARAPDASIYFRVSVATAAARRRARGGAVEHFDADPRQRAICDAYEALLQAPPAHAGPVHIIDAEADVPTVTRQLEQVVQRLLESEP
jgi:dTMP kinase